MFWKVILAIWSPGTSHWPHHPPHKRSWPIVSNLASSCYSLPIPPSHLSSLTDPRKPDSFLLCWVVKSSQCSFPKFCSSSPPFCIQKPTRSLIGPALSRKNLWFEATFSPLAYVPDWEEGKKGSSTFGLFTSDSHWWIVHTIKTEGEFMDTHVLLMYSFEYKSPPLLWGRTIFVIYIYSD